MFEDVGICAFCAFCNLNLEILKLLILAFCRIEAYDKLYE